MSIIAFAGASFPCGVGDMAEVARRHGYDPILLDHPHNARPGNVDVCPVRYVSGLPLDVAKNSGMLVPLLESWVSEGRQLPPSAALCFDRRAATISRSKLALSYSLAMCGIPAIRRIPIYNVEQALRIVSRWDCSIVLRTDTGYSGRGVRVASSADELRTLWSCLSRERISASYTKMRSRMGQKGDERLVIEPWLPGNEWSADCVVGQTGVTLIRVCEKATAICQGRPITLGYRLINSEPLWNEIRQAIEKWTALLFTARVLCFACYDIRRLPSGHLVPLDFGVRLGGDGIPHLIRRAGGTVNPYAFALDSALLADGHRSVELSQKYFLVHAFARSPGWLARIQLDRPGEVVDSKPTGFRIEESGISVYRIGSVLVESQVKDDFFKICRTASEWIHVKTKRFSHNH